MMAQWFEGRLKNTNADAGLASFDQNFKAMPHSPGLAGEKPRGPVWVQLCCKNIKSAISIDWTLSGLAQQETRRCNPQRTPQFPSRGPVHRHTTQDACHTEQAAECQPPKHPAIRGQQQQRGPCAHSSNQCSSEAGASN